MVTTVSVLFDILPSPKGTGIPKHHYLGSCFSPYGVSQLPLCLYHLRFFGLTFGLTFARQASMLSTSPASPAVEGEANFGDRSASKSV
jgi:hypothetical protein